MATHVTGCFNFASLEELGWFLGDVSNGFCAPACNRECVACCMILAALPPPTVPRVTSSLSYFYFNAGQAEGTANGRRL